MHSGPAFRVSGSVRGSGIGLRSSGLSFDKIKTRPGPLNRKGRAGVAQKASSNPDHQNKNEALNAFRASGFAFEASGFIEFPGFGVRFRFLTIVNAGLVSRGMPVKTLGNTETPQP